MSEVRMPKMGDGMVEGTVLRWLKHEGDQVAVNETIAEIETDKANVEMPAEDAGTLSKIVVKEGETVPVGAVIAYIGGVPSGATSPPVGNGSAAKTTEPVPSSSPMVTGEAGSKAQGSEAAPPADAGSSAPSTGPEAERVKASPLARKMAEETGIDLARIQGTGGGVGRVTQRDVEAYLQQRGTLHAPAVPATVREAQPVPAVAASAAPSLEGEDTAVSKMRKAIARRTVQSKQTIPHFYLVVPVEMDRAIDMLTQLNNQAPDQKITINDIIVKACAVALQKFPDVNVSWTPEDMVRRYRTINIGVAVGTDQGLTIPVINDCGSKSLRQISTDARDLVNRARANQLTPQQMSGSTFSVSNLGMFGIEEFMAIINPPDSCMLAVGAASKEVVVAEDGSFVVRHRMRVTLSCDHRTVDGVLGARFLQELRRLLENPVNLLV